MNSKAERMTRTITNIICTLLFQASLSACYWTEGLHIATYLLNHPLQGDQSSYSFLHPLRHRPFLYAPSCFGCVCYPNTSATTPHKLSRRSTHCLFLGYSSDHKGYWCLVLLTHHIIISRHVFDEDPFPLAGSSPPPYLDSSMSISSKYLLFPYPWS